MMRATMAKRVLIAAGILAAIDFHCVKKPGPKTATNVTQESSMVKFWGYKVAGLIAATPEQLDDRLTDPDNLKMANRRS